MHPDNIEIIVRDLLRPVGVFLIALPIGIAYTRACVRHRRIAFYRVRWRDAMKQGRPWALCLVVAGGALMIASYIWPALH